MNYINLYKENSKDFEFRMHELKKRIGAYLISEEKIPEEDMNQLYIIRSNLERIFTVNLGVITKLIEKINNFKEKIDDSNKGYLDSVNELEIYKKKHDECINLKDRYKRIENAITDVFNTFDRYDDFYKSNPNTEYTFDSFNRLITALNLKDNFTHKLSAPNLSLKPLDQLSRRYLKVFDGVDEFIERNELINLGRLEEILKLAEQEGESFFKNNNFSSPAAPKVRAISKNNGHSITDFSIPEFFNKLSIYLRKKIGKFYSAGPGKEQIELVTDEQAHNYLNGDNIS